MTVEEPLGVWKVTIGAVMVVEIVVTLPEEDAVWLRVIVVHGTVGADVTLGADVEAT